MRHALLRFGAPPHDHTRASDKGFFDQKPSFQIGGKKKQARENTTKKLVRKTKTIAPRKLEVRKTKTIAHGKLEVTKMLTDKESVALSKRVLY